MGRLPVIIGGAVGASFWMCCIIFASRNTKPNDSPACRDGWDVVSGSFVDALVLLRHKTFRRCVAIGAAQHEPLFTPFRPGPAGPALAIPQRRS